MAQIKTRTGLPARTAITEAARRILREEGSAEVSLARVAADVGVTKAGVYHHFKTKDELMLAAYGPVVDGVRRLLAAPISREERIDRLIELAVEQQEIVALCSPAPGVGEEAASAVSELRDELLEALAPPGATPAWRKISMAMFIGALTAGVSAPEFDRGSAAPLRDALRALAGAGA